MQTERKRSILKTMGIEVWLDRFLEKDAETVFHFLPLSNELCILADYNTGKAADEKNLLEAIAKALGVIRSGECKSKSEIEALLPQSKNIILMGENFIEFGKSPNIIRTYSPAQLLENPKLKAETWQSIRHLKIE